MVPSCDVVQRECAAIIAADDHGLFSCWYKGVQSLIAARFFRREESRLAENISNGLLGEQSVSRCVSASAAV